LARRAEMRERQKLTSPGTHASTDRRVTITRPPHARDPARTRSHPHATTQVVTLDDMRHFSAVR
jgi:hypothetical protein